MDTEVLIVGAGPTGLMLANQLVRHGVRPRIIDRHSGPARQSRAMAVHARTLEIYARLGIVERALELGRRGAGANLWAQGELTARIPIGDIGKDQSPYPFVLMLGQDDNERILGDRLRQSGVEIEWNTEMVALQQLADHARVTLKQPDGSMRTLTASWVAGCDGSRSPVRAACGIGFPGAPYEQAFFVADTVATGAMTPDELNVYLWKRGFHLFFPMRGTDRWRLIGLLPADLRDRDDLTLDDVVPYLKRQAGSQLSIHDCLWFSTYRIHHRCAERFRDRRCFLLGDAAHIHSPMGGQGMNTGLQDAYNLAWKLALVVNGQAHAALLDSYEQERRPVAQRLLHTTDRAFTLVVSDGWLARLFRTQVLARVVALAMGRERARRLAFRSISQIGIRYRRSTLSRNAPGLARGAPRAGDRFPWLRLKFDNDGPAEDVFGKLDDSRFALIVIGQPAPQSALAEAGSMRTHVVADDEDNRRALARAHITGAAFYLLRPDGHIGLAGKRLDGDAIVRYLGECIRMSGATSHAPTLRPA